MQSTRVGKGTIKLSPLLTLFDPITIIIIILMIQLGTFAWSKVVFAYQSYDFNPSLWLWSLQLPPSNQGRDPKQQRAIYWLWTPQNMVQSLITMEYTTQCHNSYTRSFQELITLTTVYYNIMVSHLTQVQESGSFSLQISQLSSVKIPSVTLKMFT